jgi:hypothetical protein
MRLLALSASGYALFLPCTQPTIQLASALHLCSVVHLQLMTSCSLGSLDAPYLTCHFLVYESLCVYFFIS